MRAVIQRVSEAKIHIEGTLSGEMGQGLVVLLGVMVGDTQRQAEVLAKKIAGLRIFTDDEGKMNRSLVEIGGSMLIVSNFTLGADCKKGRRPSFTASAPPALAEPLYEFFISFMRSQGVQTVLTGQFGADMQVALVNDGPVTVILDTDQLSC